MRASARRQTQFPEPLQYVFGPPFNGLTEMVAVGLTMDDRLSEIGH